MRDLDAIIKAYDVRGIVPDQLDEALARDVGAAFVRVLGIGTPAGGPGAVVVGHDMRPSGPDLVAAFCDGVTGQGCDVIRIGLCSTDGLYFAAGRLGLPGAMFTASHNPAKYNGIKLCRAGAAPVGQDTGLAEIRELVSAGPVPDADVAPGHVRDRDLLADYATFLRSLVDLSAIRPLRVVVDAGNGMGGYTVPAVLGTAAGLPPLPITVMPMYFELDGTFPHHEANPIDPANLVDLQERVVQSGADLGLAAFDIHTWFGLFGPARLPGDVSARLNKAFVDALGTPELRSRMSALMAEAAPTTPEQFGTFVKAELDKYEGLVKASVAKAD